MEFLIGIIFIVCGFSGVGLYALTLHHLRQKEMLRISEHVNQQKFLIMNVMIEKNMLPPGGFNMEKY